MPLVGLRSRERRQFVSSQFAICVQAQCQCIGGDAGEVYGCTLQLHTRVCVRAIRAKLDVILLSDSLLLQRLTIISFLLFIDVEQEQMMPTSIKKPQT